VLEGPVTELNSASYAHQMRTIELRRNAALRDLDSFCLRATQQQASTLNLLFWDGSAPRI
jgi:hypothetical protein